MRCDRQVIASVLLPSVFAAPISQSFFRPAQLRHKHEIEVSESVMSSPISGTETALEDRNGNNHTNVHGGSNTNRDGVCHGDLHSGQWRLP